MDNCFQQLGAIGIICRSQDHHDTRLQVWGITAESEGYFILYLSQRQVDAFGAQGLMASSADGRVGIRQIGSECVKRDEHGNRPRVTTPECISWMLTRPSGAPIGTERHVLISMGPNSEGKTQSVVLENSLAGHVIGTVSTYTGLPGIVAAPADPPEPSSEPVSTSVQYAPPVQPQAARADGSIVHVVQPGDTIWAIAVAYQVSPWAIVNRNQLTDEGRLIQPGQDLVIRDPN